jgi:hypothetical protein
MDTTRIVELFIEDDFEEAGIEAISLVSRPAHDEKWMAFKSDSCSCNVDEKFEEVEELFPYTVVPEDFCQLNPKLLELGEPYSQLIDEGYEIIKMEKITPMMVHQMNQEKFTTSKPNDPSFLDEGKYKVRFKYIGPNDDVTRRFCSDMMSANRVYRKEDIDNLTDTVANSEFGFYDIFLYRGSYNCRHVWVRLLYKKTEKIRNDASSEKGLETEQPLGSGLQPNTVPKKQRQGDGGTLKPRQGPNATFKEDMGLEDACWEGYEPIGTKILDGREVPNCVPIKMTEDDFADTISDYPEGVKNAAKRAVDYAEKNGWGSCGTQVGKTRASQLAKGENISVDTLKRMYSYLSRHKSDLTSSKSYDEGCGKLMYDSWGGEPALKWAERKLESLQKQKMVFAFDEDKRIIIGAAMVPNKFIHRYDDLGNLYYVFFSKESIKKLADRFMKQKRVDQTSVDHDGVKLDSVYVTESWISEDPKLDKSHKYGFELPEGTWFVTMSVDRTKEGDQVWKMIKDKSLTGFSVEGLFAEKSIFSKEDEKINQIKQLLKSITDE